MILGAPAVGGLPKAGCGGTIPIGCIICGAGPPKPLTGAAKPFLLKINLVDKKKLELNF